MTARGGKRPAGVTALAVFFGAGAGIAAVSALALLSPGGPLEPIWRLNPRARAAVDGMEPWAALLLAVVSVACALAAAGLWRGAPWGRGLALAVLGINFAGDAINVASGVEPRAAFGLPIAAALLAYLALNQRIREFFRRVAAPESARVVVVPILRDGEGRVLLCRMPPHRGVFPGQWGLPGGGVEPGERPEEALAREVREELALELTDAKPLFFSHGRHPKLFPDGSRREIDMIFLLYECRAASELPRLNEEFAEHAWVAPGDLVRYDLNTATIATFRRLGWLEEAAR